MVQAFTGFSYAPGLAALGQGIKTWSDGMERAEERAQRDRDRQLLAAALKGNPEAAGLALAGASGLAGLSMKNGWDKQKEDREAAYGQQSLAALGQALGVPVGGGGYTPGSLDNLGKGYGASPPSQPSRTTAPGGNSTSARLPDGWKPSANTPEGVTQDEDIAIRTVMGEAMGEGPLGWRAVAGVMGNRAKGSGMSLSQVALAPNQFEPWSSRRAELQGYDPNDNRYKIVANAILPVLRGQEDDPTGGATHFYAPKAQRGLGRRAPSWDDGSGEDIGNHRFFRLGYNGAGRHGIPAQGPVTARSADEGGQPYRVAGNGPVGAPSQPTSGAPTADEVPQLIQAGVLPEQITPGYLAEMWQTQPQIRQAVEQWRTAQGGGGGSPPAPRPLANLGADPAAADAARVAQEGGPRRVLSGQYPLTSAASPGGAPPGLSRTGAAPAGGIPAAGTPEEVAAAERASGMVYTDGSYPAGLLPPAPGQVAQGGNAPPPAAPPQGAGVALSYRNPNGDQPMPVQGGSGPVATNAPTSLRRQEYDGAPAPRVADGATVPPGSQPAPAVSNNPQTWQQPENVPPAVQESVGKRSIPQLALLAADPRAPAGVREVAKSFLASALNESKVPESVKEFQWARANGETTAKTYQEWKQLGKDKLDPGERIASETSARRVEADRMGLPEGSPERTRYIAEGRLGRDEAPDKKAIGEADAAVNAANEALMSIREAKSLSAKAYDGFAADLRGAVTSNLGSERGTATMNLNNVVQTGALAQLKAIFGGNPTEGERKILLEVSGSANQPRAVRDAIFARAEAAIQRRLNASQKKAEELRAGSYYKPSSGPGRGPEARDTGGGKPAPEARFNDLIGSGMSKQDAYARMAQEGY